jgi:hypothetical protein
VELKVYKIGNSIFITIQKYLFSIYFFRVQGYESLFYSN